MLTSQIAIFAFVYSVLLVEPRMIFNRLHTWLGLRLTGPIGQVLFKIIIDCERCVAGQVALWFYPFTHLINYNFFEHIFFVCATIIQVALIKLIYEKLNT